VFRLIVKVISSYNFIFWGFLMFYIAFLLKYLFRQLTYKTYLNQRSNRLYIFHLILDISKRLVWRLCTSRIAETYTGILHFIDYNLISVETGKKFIWKFLKNNLSSCTSCTFCIIDTFNSFERRIASQLTCVNQY